MRALEVTLGSGRPFSSFGPGLERYPPTPVALVGHPPRPGRHSTARIAERFDRLAGRGLLDEVRRLAPGPAGCRARPARPSATASCWPTWRTGVPLAEAVDRGGAADPGLRPAPVGLVPAGPPDRVVGPGDDPVGCSIVGSLTGRTSGARAPPVAGPVTSRGGAR